MSCVPSVQKFKKLASFLDTGSFSSIIGGVWNIRSANHKLSFIAQLFADEKLDFLILTETWQPECDPGRMDVFSASLKDYFRAEGSAVKVFPMPRIGRSGGGISLVYDENLSMTRYKLIFRSPSTFEYLIVKVKCVVPFVLVCIYRLVTGISFPLFVSEFRDLLVSLNAIRFPCVIAGDFNVHVNDSHDSNASSFKTLLFENNFTLSAPTRPTHCFGNTLDFIITPNIFLPRLHSIRVDDSIPIDISDHFPVFFSVINSRRPSIAPQSKSWSFRRINSVDHNLLSSALEEALFPLLTKEYGLFSDYLSDFRECSRVVLDDLVPVVKKVSRKHDTPEWMDAEYIHERSVRKRLQKSNNKAAFNRQKRYCSYLVKQKRKSYYSSLASDSANQKQLFDSLKKLSDNVRNNDNLPSCNDNAALANSFNIFFEEKIKSIRNASPSLPFSHQQQEVTPAPNSITSLDSFSLTDCNEVRSIIKEHAVKVIPEDVMTKELIKEHLEVLLPHFVKFINLSLLTSSCEGLKEAHIVPILKSLTLDRELFKNYRPVSLLSFISKLIERIVHKRINNHLSSNSLLCSSQYGYKKHHSCETLLLKLVDDILVAVDQKFGVVVLLVDLSAAFDTVDHRLLLHILQFKYHITGSALSWLKCFITGRQQRVKIGDCLSDSIYVLFGVPQGSILGPLLFNLYCTSINDAFELCGFANMGYADDNLGFRTFSARSSVHTLLSDVPNCIASIRNWTRTHFLKLNSDKTQIIVFGNSSFLSSLNLPLIRSDNGELIPVRKTITLLGFELDCRVTYDKHVSLVCSTMNYYLKNLRSIRKFMSSSTAEKFVHALITNRLDQCNSLFVGMSRANISKLQVLQNSALRLVLRLPHRAHTSQHLRDMHWLPVDERCHFKLMVLIYKCLNNMAPTMLASKLHIQSALNMTLKTTIFIPHTAMGRRSFSHLGPRLWNTLPREVRVAPTVDIFKALLKHFLFNNFTMYLQRCFPYTTTRILGSSSVAVPQDGLNFDYFDYH